ncbi:MAG: zf-HC2 domain-containing protein [Moraxellaceae bacterium]|nr:zf-HC2 domain-containing protein [Moraxellaceae bacterium]
MLKCIDVLALGSVYVDGALTPAERRSLRLHMLVCRHCRRYLRSLQLTRATIAVLPVPATEQTVEQVLSAIPPTE